MARSIERRAGKRDGERPILVGEAVKDYFAPEKSMKAVTRGEIASLFSLYRRAERARRWYVRLGQWLWYHGRHPLTFFDFLHVVRKEEEAVNAIAAEMGRKPEPL